MNIFSHNQHTHTHTLCEQSH